MKNIHLLILLLLSSTFVNSQAVVSVPYTIDVGLSADKWKTPVPANVHFIDGKFIESNMLRGTQANLYFRDFRFSIPTNASIDGIDVRVSRKKKGANDVKDVMVALLKPINVTEATGKGPNLAKPDLWTETISTVLYAFPKEAVDGSGNTFQWTPTEVNKPAFGLFFGTSVGMGKGAYIQFDKIELTVRYREGTTVTTQSRIQGASSINIKQFGNRLEVKTESQGKYLLTVRNRNGVVLQQIPFIGSKSALLTLDTKCKGYCIITVEGQNEVTSMQAFIQ